MSHTNIVRIAKKEASNNNFLLCDNKSMYEELLYRAKLPTLDTPRLQVIAIIMYKVKNSLVPPYIADLFVVTNSPYRLRNHDFVIPRFRTVAFMANTA